MKKITTSNKTDELPSLFTRAEAIAKTRVSLTTFARLAKRPDFPKAIKIGSRTFYEAHEFNNFVKSLRKSAA